MGSKSIGWTKFNYRVYDPIFCLGVLDIEVKAFINLFVYFLEFLRVSWVKTGTDLAQNPNSNLDSKICWNTFL